MKVVRYMDFHEVTVIDFIDGHAVRLSEIITRNLREINQKDYSTEKIEELVLKFSHEKIMAYAKERKIFVAVVGEEPVGTLGVVKSWDGQENSYVFLTIFVALEYHQKGIGRKLIEKGEEYVKKINGTKIGIPSSITSHAFYRKMDYEYVNNTLEPDSYGCIPMIKFFERAGCGSPNRFELIKLSQNYKRQYLKFAKENAEDLRETGFYFRFPISTEETFEEDVKMLDDKVEGINIPDWEVPNSTLFLYDKYRDKIIGGVNIRHELQKNYLINGGHIGYYVGKNERKNGYAKLLLSKALEILKNREINKALITCVKGNTASAKVILSNGGVFEKEIEAESNGVTEDYERYWIDI